MMPESDAAIEATVRAILVDELDSLAVAGLLTEIEDRLGILIDDDEVDGDMLASFGSLLAFTRAKLL